LLNLHEGSGFYRPTWENDMANPRRYGQSIIADTDRYLKPDGSVIELEKIAQMVLEKVNAQVDNLEHRFLFNNHRTTQQDSMHKEQRLSASYYALTQCNIPAFGVESSKSIKDLGLKVHYHNLVIKAFMDYFNIIPQTPSVYLPEPEFHYLMIKVNNEKILRAVPKGSELSIKSGDTIRVEHIEGNYSRGFYCSVMGLGGINDLGKDFIINKPTRILVRKDNKFIGEIKIVTEAAEPARLALAPPEQSRSRAEPAPDLESYTRDVPALLISVAGKLSYIPDKGSISIVRGDKIKLIDMFGLPPDTGKLEVNFKGYVPPSQFNTGDDRGFLIDTATDLRPDYAKNMDDGSAVYNIEISRNRKILASMQLIIVQQPRWEYVLVKGLNGEPALYYPGQDLLYKPGNKLQIMDVKTNLWPLSQLTLLLAASNGKEVEFKNNDILDDDFITEAWEKGCQLSLKWLHAGKLAGQINIKQR
jgi:hypothetical protein